ncbi:MAG: phosphatase PAP2 family protein [Terracidiphilus sp.]
MPKDSFRHLPPATRPIVARLFSIAVLALIFCMLAPAQAPAANPANNISVALPDAPAPQHSTPDDVTIGNVPRNLLHDQGAIWSGPAHIRTRDLRWLLPLAAASGVAFATDQHTMNQVVPRDPSFNQASINTSNVLIGGWIVVPAAVYGFGRAHQDEHAREAGILTGQSMMDGVVVEEVLKLIFMRERPNVDDARGHFFQTSAGVDSSFPSSHALVAWSAASALAAEYPAPWTQFALYSAATSVSLTRVIGQQHFPSDVLVGSAIGWLIGHNVVKRHHHHEFKTHAIDEGSQQ